MSTENVTCQICKLAQRQLLKLVPLPNNDPAVFARHLHDEHGYPLWSGPPDPRWAAQLRKIAPGVYVGERGDWHVESIRFLLGLGLPPEPKYERAALGAIADFAKQKGAPVVDVRGISHGN